MKYLIVVFLALFALQGAYGNELEQLHNEKIVQVVADLVKDVIAAIVKAVNHILSQLEPIMETIKTLAQSTITGAAGLINGVLNETISIVEELVKEADILGLNISMCPVGTALEGVRQLLIPGIENITACANTTISDVAKVVDDVTKFRESLIAGIKDIGEEAEKCSGLTIIVCIANIVFKLTGLLVSIPAQIIASLPKFTKDLQTLTVNLATCTTGIINGITYQATNLIKDVVTCLTDIIGHGRL